MTEKTKPADVQEGQIIYVRKDNALPPSRPTLMLHPAFLIRQGLIPNDATDHIVIQINAKHFNHFADACIQAGFTMDRMSEDDDKILYRLHKSSILTGKAF